MNTKTVILVGAIASIGLVGYYLYQKSNRDNMLFAQQIQNMANNNKDEESIVDYINAGGDALERLANIFGF